MASIQNDKKVINAWSMYDWANSVYPLVITSTIFPIYYEAVTSKAASDHIHFLGMEFVNTALYSYALSIAFLIIACLSPLLSAIADYTGGKKRFMQFFCYLGAASCSALYFFEANTLWLGLAAFMMATIGFSGSLVFYNAYLPEIATSDMQDKVSARGFALGYIGSSLLLIFNLTMVLKPEWYGIASIAVASRISFLTVGIWWAVFAQIPFYFLPDGDRKKGRQTNLLLHGYQELIKVWKEVRFNSALSRFLVSFFVYNMALQTVMNMATIFGSKELKLESSQLIITVLIIQFVAIAGAFLFSRLSGVVGNIKALGIAIIVWIGICIGAYFVQGVNGFYVVAFFVGMVMGGIQSLSRSTYSKMLPAESHNHASYFSFYDVCDKMGYFFGILSFGIIEELTGSMRNSIIVLVLFFCLGLFLLLRIGNKNELKSQ